MAAITKRLLQLRPTFHAHARPYASTHHHFSSSSDRDDKPQSEQPDKDKVSSMLSSFNDNSSSSSDRDDKPQAEQPGLKVSSILSSLSDVRASLQNQPPPPDRRQPLRSPFSQTPRPPGSGSPSGEIYSRLAEFRSRSAPPPPPNPQHSSGQYASFQELFEKRVPPKGEGSAAPSGPDGGGSSSFDPIRQSLNRLQSSGSVDSGRNPPESWSLSRFTGSMKSKANPNANLVRGSGNLTSPFLSKDAKGKGFGGMGLRNMDDRKSLGDKLKTLRPVKRKGNWFSLQELNDRLAKVKETEDSELEKSGLPVEAIKQSLFYIKKNSEQPKNKGMPISILGSMGVALDENTGPPKDHLVERYFHPDNMSSAEKLKLELQKVRDEFKMSESDCGSARVQVAQLTTKIKHLSTALHKKDKHSRKGLHEMVQRRKKLLKYLRRTDWDSYCLVLSKLGLRDNPDIKA